MTARSRTLSYVASALRSRRAATRMVQRIGPPHPDEGVGRGEGEDLPVEVRARDGEDRRAPPDPVDGAQRGGRHDPCAEGLRHLARCRRDDGAAREQVLRDALEQGAVPCGQLDLELAQLVIGRVAPAGVPSTRSRVTIASSAPSSATRRADARRVRMSTTGPRGAPGAEAAYEDGKLARRLAQVPERHGDLLAGVRTRGQLERPAVVVAAGASAQRDAVRGEPQVRDRCRSSARAAWPRTRAPRPRCPPSRRPRRRARAGPWCRARRTCARPPAASPWSLRPPRSHPAVTAPARRG